MTNFIVATVKADALSCIVTHIDRALECCPTKYMYMYINTLSFSFCKLFFVFVSKKNIFDGFEKPSLVVNTCNLTPNVIANGNILLWGSHAHTDIHKQAQWDGEFVHPHQSALSLNVHANNTHTHIDKCYYTVNSTNDVSSLSIIYEHSFIWSMLARASRKSLLPPIVQCSI